MKVARDFKSLDKEVPAFCFSFSARRAGKKTRGSLGGLPTRDLSPWQNPSALRAAQIRAAFNSPPARINGEINGDILLLESRRVRCADHCVFIMPRCGTTDRRSWRDGMVRGADPTPLEGIDNPRECIRSRLFYESPFCVKEVARAILFSFVAVRSATRSPGSAGGREWARRSLVGTRPPQPGGRCTDGRRLVGPFGPDVPVFLSSDVAAGVPFFYPSLSRLSTR